MIRSPNEIPKDWENQLRAAAYGEQSVLMGTSKPTQALEVESGMEPVLLSKTGNGASSLIQAEIGRSKIDEHGHKTKSSAKERPTTTAPKKMIAICAGGKLVSPSPATLALNPNVKRKKRDIIDDDNCKSAIVRIKYGSTEESRKTIAQKIQDIISGTTARANHEVKSLRSFEAAIISKPTHPFFLGATSRKNEPKIISESTSEGDLMTSRVLGKQHMDSRPNEANSVKEVTSNAHASASLATLQQISNSLGKFRTTRYPGVMEPIWPPKEMAHVRPLLHELGAPSARKFGSRTFCTRRKLKYAKVRIAGDKEILHSYSKLLRQQPPREARFKGKTMDELSHPIRKVMTGADLQATAQSLLSHRLSIVQPVVSKDDMPDGSQIWAENTHSALVRIYKDIHSSSTAFDRFECETHDWIHKYAPKRAEEVLQSGSEALVLRDWLKSLTVTSVGSGNSESHNGQDKSVPSRKLNANFKRRKRKRAEELDGFVISSDEENFEMEELPCPEISDAGYHFAGKKSIVRAVNILGPNTEQKRACNAIVISGPHGCGKTAAVYAVARELDFEVFEINSGSRRSGKDILEKVGDMTKNHLVNQTCDIKGDEFVEEITDPRGVSVHGLDSGRQKNVKPALQPHREFEKKRRGRPKIHPKPLNTNGNLKEKRRGKKKDEEEETENEKEKRKRRKKQSQSQRQSLILLEEVDVLFEEDKQFWSTTLDLILHSKRPIIMTCTEERLLPLDEMVIFALLRFTPPPEPLAIDYLILIASSEGHLLSRTSLSSLWRSKYCDLRASIAELNFFCQMAVGDTKGGLEWMLIQPSSSENQTKDGTNLRVVSVETYRDNLKRLQQSHEREALVHEARDFFHNDWGSWNVHKKHLGERGVTLSQSQQEKRKIALQRLVAFEEVMDALSAADTHIFSDYRQDNQVGGMSLLHALMLNHTEAARSNAPKYFRETEDGLRRELHCSQRRACRGPL